MTKMTQRSDKEASATIVESPQARSSDRAAIREDLPEDTDSDLPIEASWGTPVKILKAIPPERIVASINYFIADKYLRALTEIAHSPNQKVLMLPIEATSVLGTLGGIAEVVKATFGGTPGGTRGSAPPRQTVPALARNP